MLPHVSTALSSLDRSDSVQRPLKFASSNRHKFSEVQAILADYRVLVEMAPVEIREIQADALEEIAAEKARAACRRLDGPAMVKDTGLFIHDLHAFSGPYSAYV